MSAASPSSPSHKIDSMSNDALVQHLTDRQRRDLDAEFYAYLRDMNFVSEVEEPRELVERVQKIGAYALAAWERCSERFIERLRNNIAIDLPQENPEEYDLGERWERWRGHGRP